MNTINDVEELAKLYDAPVQRSITKVSPLITPLYQRWISAARFVVIATVGSEGCDASPRGDIDNLVKIPNPKTVWIPDWAGNNRLDSLKNIIRDGRISLMFMVNGCNNVIRINGTAVVAPKTVTVVTVEEVYFQCAKALMRSDLWNPATPVPHLPTAGEFCKEQESSFDSKAYDDGYVEYAKEKFW